MRFQPHHILEKTGLCRQWKDGRLPGAGGVEMNRRNPEEFKGHEASLNDIIVEDTCPYTFIQTQRTSNTKSEP